MPLRFLTEVIVACLCLLAQQYTLLAVSENLEETCWGEGFEIFVSARKEGEGWKVRLERI
jgi:hypothetical protein